MAPQRILIVNNEPGSVAPIGPCSAATAGSSKDSGTGRDAILRLDQRDIDVVVLDLMLPDIGGVEIMEWMERNRIATSVIVFSADESIDSAIHALRRGAFGVHPQTLRSGQPDPRPSSAHCTVGGWKPNTRS